MIAFPNCKINLGLNIVSKRLDGFHNIETVFYPIGLNDVVEVLESDLETEVFQSGIAIPSETSENICLKAYNILNEKFSIPKIKIYLHKTIPIGAGLGGGSADGAFMLKLLNEKFSLNLAENELEDFAKILGADCAFFVKNKPVYATDKGDCFTDVNVNLAGKYIYIIKPNVFVSTAEAYKNVVITGKSCFINEKILLPLADWKNHIYNNFEINIFKNYPIIQEIKEQFYLHGAVYASMSGSGSAVYGIFDQKPNKLNLFEDCFYWIGQI